MAGRVNAVRGLYRLRVTFAAPPPEDILLTVGWFRVLVREAGAYDFPLEKGVRHAVSLSFVPDGEAVGRVTARRFVAETRLSLAAPGAVVFERAHTNAPGDAVPMRSSSLRATAAWATAEAGTVRLSCEPAGAFAAVADGARTPLPCEWASAKDAADSREVALEGGEALAEAGGAAKLTLAFEPDGGGAAVEEEAEVRAYELRVEAAAEWPPNRIRHVFGPLEKVVASIVPMASSIEWSGAATNAHKQSCIFVAPYLPEGREESVSVDGTTFDFELVTIAPTHFRALAYDVAEDGDWDGGCPTEGQVGVGLSFFGLQLLPDWVSFRHVKVMEGFCEPTDIRGIFDFEGAETNLLPHGEREGAGIVLGIGAENFAGGDFAGTSFENINQPWRSGSFQYDIPQYWRTIVTGWRQFGTESQIFTFSPNGDLAVEKFGVAATRGTNGVSRITKESER